MEAMNAALEVIRATQDWPSDQTVTIGAGVEGLVRIELRLAGRLQQAIEVRPGGDASIPAVSPIEKPKRSKTKEPTVTVAAESGKESVSAPVYDYSKATRTPSEEKIVPFALEAPTIDVEMPAPGFTGAPPLPDGYSAVTNLTGQTIGIAGPPIGTVEQPPPAQPLPKPGPGRIVDANGAPANATEPKLAVPPGRSYKITIPPGDWKRLDPNQRAKLKRAMRKAAIEPIEANDTIHTDAFPGNSSGVPELMTLLRKLEIGAESTKAA